MRIAILLIAACVAFPSYGANLIISEIVDAPLPGGLPKFVELTNTGNTSIDLSGFSIGNQNNAATEMQLRRVCPVGHTRRRRLMGDQL